VLLKSDGHREEERQMDERTQESNGRRHGESTQNVKDETWADWADREAERLEVQASNAAPNGGSL
jgi:hypothetical protein